MLSMDAKAFAATTIILFPLVVTRALGGDVLKLAMCMARCVEGSIVSDFQKHV